VFFFAFNLLTTVLSLPLSYYNTFVLEEKFGFNKQTVKLWVTDMLKGQALGIALGGPIMAAILKIIQKTGNQFLLPLAVQHPGTGLCYHYLSDRYFAVV